MPRILPLLCCLCLAAAPAWADTLLHLTETATAEAHPDELVATLRADVTSASTAEAQQRVNSTMAAALAQAKATPGVSATTGGYYVWRLGPSPREHAEQWQANQSLTLRGRDGAALLKLVGTLQQKGLAVSQLGWQLSDAAQQDAQHAALRKAIATLRTRADEIAALLDLRFGAFKEVRIGGPPPRPILLQRAMAMPPASASMTPPSAEAADVSVTATVDADAVLLAK